MSSVNFLCRIAVLFRIPVMLLAIVFVVASCKDDPVAPLPVVESDPVITSIQPDSAYIGDEIVITGEHFSSVTSANIVTFAGGVQGTVVAATSTSLVVTVPVGAVTGKIGVSVGGKTKESKDTLIVLDINIRVSLHSEASHKVSVGENVMLYATGVPNDSTKIIVKFGNVTATIISIERFWAVGIYVLVVRVPQGAVSGPVTLISRGKTALTVDQLEIINRLLPHKHCVVEITGLRVQINRRIVDRYYDGNGNTEEVIIDTTYWEEFFLTIDTRNFPYLGWESTNLDLGFIDNVYSFTYSRTEPSDLRTSKKITIELDPTDYALLSFQINNIGEPSESGGHRGAWENTRKEVVVTNLHQLGNNYEYEVAGDILQPALDSLAYSSIFTSSGPGEARSSSEKLVSYECPSTARVKIRFVE